MSKGKAAREQRKRHQENRRLKFGTKAVPKHKRLGGRTGKSMRKNGKSVRS